MGRQVLHRPQDVLVMSCRGYLQSDRVIGC